MRDLLARVSGALGALLCRPGAERFCLEPVQLHSRPVPSRRTAGGAGELSTQQQSKTRAIPWAAGAPFQRRAPAVFLEET